MSRQVKFSDGHHAGSRERLVDHGQRAVVSRQGTSAVGTGTGALLCLSLPWAAKLGTLFGRGDEHAKERTKFASE